MLGCLGVLFACVGFRFGFVVAVRGFGFECLGFWGLGVVWICLVVLGGLMGLVLGDSLRLWVCFAFSWLFLCVHFDSLLVGCLFGLSWS